MADSITRHMGIIYQSSNSWRIGPTRFIVIERLDNIFENMVKVKLLDKPLYQSANRSLQPGYAQISLNSIESCTIVEDNRNIMTYLRLRLSLFQ